MNRPEWITILIGCIASVIAGLCQSLFAVLLTNIIYVRNILSSINFNSIFFFEQAFKSCREPHISHHVMLSSLSLLFLGLFLLVIRFFQVMKNFSFQ